MPKNIVIGGSFLLMGFPDFGNSYFLLMHLDKEFKIVFELLETQPEQPDKSSNIVVVRAKKIVVSQMQMLEDEMSLAILDLKKVLTFLPGVGTYNQPSEYDLLSDLSHEGLMPVTSYPPSSFASVIDEIFELERGVSVPYSTNNISSSMTNSGTSHLTSLPSNHHHSSRVGISSPKWDANVQMSHANPAVKIPTHYSGSRYLASSVEGLSQSTSLSSLPFSHQRNNGMQELSVSKSEQDLASLRSPQSAEVSSFRSMDEDHLRFVNEQSRDLISDRQLRLSSPHSAGAAPNSLFSTPVCKISTTIVLYSMIPIWLTILLSILLIFLE